MGGWLPGGEFGRSWLKGSVGELSNKWATCGHADLISPCKWEHGSMQGSTWAIDFYFIHFFFLKFIKNKNKNK